METNRCERRAATEISKQCDPKDYNAQTQVAKEGGSVAKAARKSLESKLGRSVILKSKARDYLLPDKAEEEPEWWVMNTKITKKKQYWLFFQ